MRMEDVIKLLDSEKFKVFTVSKIAQRFSITYVIASNHLKRAVDLGYIKRVGHGQYASLSYVAPTDAFPAQAAAKPVEAAQPQVTQELGFEPTKPVVKRKYRKRAKKIVEPEYKLVVINRTYEIPVNQLLSKLGLKGDLIDVFLFPESTGVPVECVRLQLSETPEQAKLSEVEQLQRAVEEEEAEEKEEEEL